MKLTAENVEKLFKDCTSANGEQVEGILIKIKLDTSGRARDIGRLLSQLPDEFHIGKGGGWSFLNSCNTKNGDQWTGLHLTMEKLLMLGLASKQVVMLMPRDMWSIIPGGMPYFAVELNAIVGGEHV